MKRKIYYVAYFVCPIITILFSLTIGFVTMYMENTIPPFFIFISVQFYLNWYLVCNISRKVSIPFTIVSWPQKDETGTRFWYCEKCKHYTRRPAQHCPFCKKCYYYRDHHCFFLGCCILRQNMGNFILVCLYTFLACIYSVWSLCPHLYEYFVNVDTTKFNVYYFILNFFFPVTMVKYFIIGDESINVLLVTLLNAATSIGFFAFIYGFWKLYSCLSGKQKYYLESSKKQDIYEIFGSYGFFNLIFPFNGFLHSKSIDEKYELKSV